MFRVIGDDSDNDDENADVDVAVNYNRKSRSIVRIKSTFLGGMR